MDFSGQSVSSQSIMRGAGVTVYRGGTCHIYYIYLTYYVQMYN